MAILTAAGQLKWQKYRHEQIQARWLTASSSRCCEHGDVCRALLSVERRLCCARNGLKPESLVVGAQCTDLLEISQSRCDSQIGLEGLEQLSSSRGQVPDIGNGTGLIYGVEKFYFYCGSILPPILVFLMHRQFSNIKIAVLI